MAINSKQLYVDTDRAVSIVAANNPVTTSIQLTKGNDILICANCYVNSSSNVASTFALADTWALYIGETYCSNAHPVIIISDQSKWNQTSDWAVANVLSGNICVSANVDGTTLTTDLADLSSKGYTMEIVLVNNVSNSVVVADIPCTINNSVEL